MRRSLTELEKETTQWLIERSEATGSLRAQLQADLREADVEQFDDGSCGFFTYIKGVNENVEAMTRHLSLVAPDMSYGVFLYSTSGHLAGVDVYGLTNPTPRTTLPAPEELAGWRDFSNNQAEPTAQAPRLT